jgi:hypothetical protein
MSAVGRRLDRIEAEFAPSETEAVRKVISQILASGPPRRPVTDPDALARIERFRQLAPSLVPAHPLKRIELAGKAHGSWPVARPLPRPPRSEPGQ